MSLLYSWGGGGEGLANNLWPLKLTFNEDVFRVVLGKVGCGAAIYILEVCQLVS